MKSPGQIFVMSVLALGGLVLPARGAVQTFVDDYVGFVAAAGPLSIIDFETLPNGSPSVAGTLITDLFNYDLHGAHFSASQGVPRITGNSVSGFGLTSEASIGQIVSLVASMSTPAFGVGVHYPGPADLLAYNSQGMLLGTAGPPPQSASTFLGIVSDEPIATAIIRGRISISSISEFQFSPVPEPMTAALILGAAVGLGVTRRRFAGFVFAGGASWRERVGVCAYI